MYIILRNFQPIIAVPTSRPIVVGNLIFRRSIIYRALASANTFSNIVCIGEQIRQVRQMPMMSAMEREVRMQAAKEITGDIRLQTIIGPNVVAARWDAPEEELSSKGPSLNKQRYAARCLQEDGADNTRGIYFDIQQDADRLCPEIEKGADLSDHAAAYNNFLRVEELRQFQNAGSDGKAALYFESGEPVVVPDPIPPLPVDPSWNIDTAIKSIVKKFRVIRDSLVDGENLTANPSDVTLTLAGRTGGDSKLPITLATEISDLSVCDSKIYIFPQNHPSVGAFQSVIQRQSMNPNRPVVTEIVPGVSFQQIMDALDLLISFFA